jgi:DNA-binding NarL/FixJ family response regulator
MAEDRRRTVQVAPIRILLAAMPPLVLDMIEQTVREQPDMAVVAVVATRADIEGAMRAADAQFVIVGSGGRSEVATLNILDRHPNVRVIEIQEDTGRAYLCERLGSDMAFGDVVEAIRRSAGQPPVPGSA